MQFSTGQLVVHPHHGPSVVQGIRDLAGGGQLRTYVDLAVRRTNLTVSIPLDMAEEIGVRPLFGLAGVARLLKVLQAPSRAWERQWSRRMKENQERLRHGDLFETAAVVRDLARRDQENPLSTAERELLRTASRPILGELVESLEITDEAAEALVTAAVQGEELPILEELALAS